MAISKKGMRPISVNDIKYHWKFTGKVFVTPDEETGALLIIDFGWYDIFDYMGDSENCPPDFEPAVATPKFVATSIEFATENGWSNGKMEIKYRERKYFVIKQNT